MGRRVVGVRSETGVDGIFDERGCAGRKPANRDLLCRQAAIQGDREPRIVQQRVLQIAQRQTQRDTLLHAPEHAPVGNPLQFHAAIFHRGVGDANFVDPAGKAVVTTADAIADGKEMAARHNLRSAGDHGASLGFAIDVKRPLALAVIAEGQVIPLADLVTIGARRPRRRIGPKAEIRPQHPLARRAGRAEDELVIGMGHVFFVDQVRLAIAGQFRLGLDPQFQRERALRTQIGASLGDRRMALVSAAALGGERFQASAETAVRGGLDAIELQLVPMPGSVAGVLTGIELPEGHDLLSRSVVAGIGGLPGLSQRRGRFFGDSEGAEDRRKHHHQQADSHGRLLVRVR